MTTLTVFALVAVAAAMFSLACGIRAMAHDSIVAHYYSAHWMVWRVVCQAVALALILLALVHGS